MSHRIVPPAVDIELDELHDTVLAVLLFVVLPLLIAITGVTA